MEYEISQQERGIADPGYKQPRESVKTQDELTADIVKTIHGDLAHIYDENSLVFNSINSLLEHGGRMFDSFRSVSSDHPLTKYKYAEIYLDIYNRLRELEKTKAQRAPDGSLMESYTDWVADPQRPGSTMLVQKNRPWSPLKIKTVKDHPAFTEEKLKQVEAYILKTVPGRIEYVEDKEAEKEKQKEKRKQKSQEALSTDAGKEKYIAPTSALQEIPTGDNKVDGITVTYKPNRYLTRLLTDDSKYNYTDVQVEDLALAIRGISVRKIEAEEGRDLAREYIRKFVNHPNPDIADKLRRNYDRIKEEILAVKSMNPDFNEDSGIQAYIPFFFSSYSMLNLHYDLHVDIGDDLVKMLTGELQKELSKKYLLHHIDENLEKYFKTQEKADFISVLRSVTRSRHLMVLYLEDDYVEQESKRSTFFRAFEAALYDNEFPSDYKSFFKDIEPAVRSIYDLLDKEKIEEAIGKNKQVYEIYLKIQEKLAAYERDKQKWGRRALFLITLAIELLITYLTAGFIRAIPARAGLLVNLLMPALKQELYLAVGMIEKRDFKNLGIEAVTATASMKISTMLMSKLKTVYNIESKFFTKVVMDNLMVNFTAALQQELVHLARKTVTLDDFLSELFKNFVSGVLHEKAATIAISRIQKSEMNALIRKGDPSVVKKTGGGAPQRFNNNKNTEAPATNKPPIEMNGRPDPSAQGTTNKGSKKIPPLVLKPGEDIHPNAAVGISKAPQLEPDMNLAQAMGVGLPPIKIKTSWGGAALKFKMKMIAEAIGLTKTQADAALAYIKKNQGIRLFENIIVNMKGEVYLSRKGSKPQFIDKLQDAIKDINWLKSDKARVKLIEWTKLYGPQKAQLIMKTIEQRASLREALGLDIRFSQGHHYVPVELLKTHPVAQAAVAEGFRFNTSDNGVGIPTTYHLREHDQYNIEVGKLLSDWAAENPGYTPGMAKAFIENSVVPQCMGHIQLGHPLYPLWTKSKEPITKATTIKQEEVSEK